VPERVQFKIAVLTFKVLHGLAPQYLGPLNRVADLPGRRSLRSAGTSRLVVKPVMLSSVANRAFQVAGPRIWNDLPVDVTSAESLSIRSASPATENSYVLEIISRLFPGY